MYIITLHVSQLLCNTMRFMLLGLFHEAAIRIVLMSVMLKQRVNVANIRVYQEISAVTRSLFVS